MIHLQICTICSDKISGLRGDFPICLACFVFFRRSVSSDKKYVCRKDGKCRIHLESRSNCRSCRWNKCVDRGLVPRVSRSTPLKRAKEGPRKCSFKFEVYKPIPSSSDGIQGFKDSESFISSVDIPDFMLLQRLQQKQHVYHRKSSSILDVNFILTFSFKNAHEWAMQFKIYRELGKQERNMVLAEYTFAYMGIDQAFKTSQEAGEEGIWLLQNDAVLRAGSDVFVKLLVETLAKPFRNLKLDRIECVALKTLLLVTPSTPNNILFKGSETVKSQHLTQLFNYSLRKSAEHGAERYGEILLLIGAIRCAVKEFYNATKQEGGVFELRNLDSGIRKRMLS